MYKVFNGDNWLEFDTYSELLNWIAQFNVRIPGKKICDENTFLNKVGNNDNDTYVSRERDGTYVFIFDRMYPRYVTVRAKRECRVVNGDGNSIYNSKLISDVFKTIHDRKMMMDSFRKMNGNKVAYYSRQSYWALPKSAYPEFRRGPWPYIHVNHSKWNYRYIRTTQERRMTCCKEAEPFNRASRAYNLPDTWIDEPIRDWRNDGWKSQSKNRHQWENKVKQKVKHKYGKNTYVVKNHNKRNIEEDFYDYTDYTDAA